MVKNNHLNNNKRKLNELLQSKALISSQETLTGVLGYARLMADIENLLVVVSDMVEGKSHIVAGGFAHNLNLEDYQNENSIWESRIFSLMSDEELEEKCLAELRFFHYLRHLPKNKKSDYYLVSKLRFRFPDGHIYDVLHRMYYIFDQNMENIRYAICTYGPLSFGFSGKSYAVNSITGIMENLTDSVNDTILTSRERQILSMVDTGMKSSEIAERLNISKHTVSRHRQEIISKLQVKNTHEACRIAKNLQLI